MTIWPASKQAWRRCPTSSTTCYPRSTSSTVEVVRELTSDERLPQTAGLRLSANDDQPGAVNLLVVEAPSPSDQVIDEQGAHVFVAAELAPALEHKLLDADMHQERVSFSLADAPQGLNKPGN